MDSYNYKHVNNPDARDQFLDMLIDYNLIDVWRDLNMEEKQFTWRRKITDQKARLDYFLISEILLVQTNSAKVCPGYRTDHSMIFLQLNFGKTERGTTYWKFNNSLLKDLKYVQEIKQVIQNVKEQHASEDQTELADIKDISNQNKQFNINDQLFFEVLLIEIRGKSIAYSSYNKKQDKILEDKLIEDIENLEKEDNTNYDILVKQNELENLRKKRMEGVKVRSRARWICDGEKVTNYFCNLETRHYVSKCMNSLISNSENLIQDQNEILSETMQFYKNLYTKKDVTNIDLNSLLGNFSVPILNEDMRNKLEGPLTYSEILFCLKKSSNNTSPGYDGFSY